MGQILASDQVALYDIAEITKEHSLLSSPTNEILKPKRRKPNVLNVKFFNMDEIKAIQIYISQPLTNEFPNLKKDAYEGHKVADGYYYGIMKGEKREGDGVLVLTSKYSESDQSIQVYNYFGTFQDGQAYGQGYSIFVNNTVCWGNIKQNEFQGNCMVKTQDNSYYGLWEERKLQLGHALTQHYYYIGSFKDGMRDGFGECQYHNGTIIKGFWRMDTLDMLAKIIFPDGSEFSGTFYKGVKQGFGYFETNDYEFYGDYDNNVKNGLGVSIEKWEDPEPKNQFSQNLTKITESFYIKGIPQGLYCVTENNKKQWFYRNQIQIEPLVHIKEKRSLAEIYDQENLDNQKSKFDIEINQMLLTVYKTVEKCETFKVLEQQLDNQTQKMGQLTVYWDWIKETQQKIFIY